MCGELEPISIIPKRSKILKCMNVFKLKEDERQMFGHFGRSLDTGMIGDRSYVRTASSVDWLRKVFCSTIGGRRINKQTG